MYETKRILRTVFELVNIWLDKCFV